MRIQHVAIYVKLRTILCMMHFFMYEGRNGFHS